MNRRRNPMPPKNDQKKKFIDKARELETDENEAAFEARLKRIVRAKPEKNGDRTEPDRRSKY